MKKFIKNYECIHTFTLPHSRDDETEKVFLFLPFVAYFAFHSNETVLFMYFKNLLRLNRHDVYCCIWIFFHFKYVLHITVESKLQIDSFDSFDNTAIWFVLLEASRKCMRVNHDKGEIFCRVTMKYSSKDCIANRQ